MTATLTPGASVAPIHVPAAAWVAAAAATAWLYLMLQENGAVLSHSWQYLHELFHDGRHALGVPCH